MLDLIKKLLAQLVDSPTVLRAALTALVGWLEKYAATTETQVDDLVAKVLRIIVENDDLWELVAPYLPILFGVREIPNVPIEDNPDIQNAAKIIGSTAGMDSAAVMEAFCRLAK